MAETTAPSRTTTSSEFSTTDDRPRNLRANSFFKRAFDIVVSFVGLFFLLPFFGLIGYLIKRDSPGPVFFKCLRMGRAQRPFNMWKFRTMYERPSSYEGPCITCEEDERITPIGRWLRDSKINELPQLWNVLIGEMSLVGPRPEDVGIARNWSEEDRHLIYSVRPGITSPASVLYRDEEKLLSKGNLMEDYLQNILPDKMRFDRLYVQNRNFTSDLDILFWTLAIIIPYMVRAKVPEGSLFAGPITRLVNRYVSWFVIDLLISIIVLSVVSFFWRIQAPLNWGFGNLVVLAIMFSLVFSGLNQIFGLNKILWRGADLIDAIRLSISCWVVTLLFLVLNYLQERFYLIPLPALPTSMIVIVGLFNQILFIVARYRERLITTVASSWLALRRNRMEIGERVLIVGAGDGFNTANWLLKRGEFQYVFHTVGLVDDHYLADQGMILNGCMVLGKVTDLPKIVSDYKITVIVFTTKNVPKAIKDYIDELKQNSFVRLIFLDNVSKMISQQMTIPLRAPVYSLWSEDYHEVMGMHDSITGLPNRTLFQDRLIHSLALARRYKTRPVVAFVEIDVCNQRESIGRERWNQIMKQIIDRLQKNRRESDTIAFLWGGVFAFLLESVPDDNAVNIIANRLVASLAQPIQIEDQVIHLKTTISFNQELEQGANGNGTNGSDSKQSGYQGDFLDHIFANRKVKQVLHD